MTFKVPSIHQLKNYHNIRQRTKQIYKGANSVTNKWAIKIQEGSYQNYQFIIRRGLQIGRDGVWVPRQREHIACGGTRMKWQGVIQRMRRGQPGAIKSPRHPSLLQRQSFRTASPYSHLSLQHREFPTHLGLQHSPLGYFGREYLLPDPLLLALAHDRFPIINVVSHWVSHWVMVDWKIHARKTNWNLKSWKFEIKTKGQGLDKYIHFSKRLSNFIQSR